MGVVYAGRMTYRNIKNHYVLIGFNELSINMIAVSRRTISGVTRFKRAAPMIPRQATARVPQWRLAIRIRRAVNPIVKFLPTIRPLRPFYLHTIPRKAYKKNGRCSFFFDNFDLQGFFPEFSPAPFPCPASPCGIRRSSGRLCLNAG